MKIYQAYVNQQQKNHVADCAIPLDASWNTNGNEYDLFKHLKKHQIGEIDSPWGLVSWKFTGKCQIQLNEFSEFATTQFKNGCDCVFINPMIGNEALYLNVWEQGKDCGHQGLDKVENFLTKNFDRGIKSIMSNNIFAFCNYFIATNRFWDAYFKYIDEALILLEREIATESETGLAYKSSANYKRNPNLTLKPFVIERLLSPFLLKSQLKIVNYKHSSIHYQKKFGTMLGDYLLRLSITKNEAIAQNSAAQIGCYMNNRRAFLHSTYKGVIWDLDDPNNLLY
jgi:hypothetical protein